jgi:hypothetical protein
MECFYIFIGHSLFGGACLRSQTSATAILCRVGGFASLLPGYPTSTDTPEGIPLTYRPPNRTLNLGLCCAHNTTAEDVEGSWSSLSFSPIQNGYRTLVPNRTPYSPDKKEFEPRVGLPSNQYSLGDSV